MNHELSDAKTRVKDYLDRLVVGVDKDIPGFQYVVVDRESLLWKYTGGVCDADNTATKVTGTTQFLSSSCTKVLTAAAIWKLIANGKISSVEDPLSKYFKDHPYGDALQIRHLLNHSSGIPHPIPVGPQWLHTLPEHTTTYSESQALATVLQGNPTLQFAPGERYAYSNINYWLLGKVIESVSNVSYRDYLQQELFPPLGISSQELDTEYSTNAQEDSMDEVYARGHQERWTVMAAVIWILLAIKRQAIFASAKGKWCRLQRLYMNGPAYGGVMGTALGYATFLQDMLQPQSKLFSSNDATKDILFAEQRNATGNLLPTTLGGWHRGEIKNTLSSFSTKTLHYFGKPGGGPGFHSNIRIYPEAGIATVFMANKTQISEGPINALSDILDAEFLRDMMS